jgi:hypothetical protein
MFRGLSEVKLISLLFSIYYIYTLLVGFTIQFFVLPILFPNAHWGHGLLAGGDWIQFHIETVELAKKIAKEGWSVWSLQPEPSHQSMSGITAFFYALTGIYEPWVMLFYNTFLHATSGILLYLIYREFEISERLSLIFSTIFIITPTSLTWTTQIHKDGLYIAGILLTMLAIVYSFKNSIKKNIMSVVLGFIGGVLFWIVGRGYALEITYYFYMLFLGIILITLDQDVEFRSFLDFVKYTPRALFVGFFSPLPEVWFTKGSTGGGTIARYITPFEAIYLYIAWLLLPFAIYIHRKRLYMWLLLLMCIGYVWFHTVAEPNYGPIVRKRYVYVMFLSGLSYASAIIYLRNRKIWRIKGV